MNKIFLIALLFLSWIQYLIAQYIPLQSNSLQLLLRKESSSPIKINIPISVLEDMLLIGYFKLSSTLQPSSLARIYIEDEEMNLLHLFINIPSSTVYAKSISDVSVNTKTQISLPSPSADGNWKIFGIGYKNSTNSIFLLSGYNSTSKITTISANLATSLITRDIQFQVCIGCSILGSIYSTLLGAFQNIKILTGFTLPAANSFYYLPNNMSLQLQKQSYYPNSLLLNFISLSFTSPSLSCPSGYVFFDGICLNQLNCSSIIDSQNDEFGTIQNTLFYNSSIQSCDICKDYCSLCQSNGNCANCQDGYILDTSDFSCKKCPVNSYFDPTTSTCVLSCPSSYKNDLSNRVCSQSFDPSTHVIGPFFIKRELSQNNDFSLVVTSTLEIISPQFESCVIGNNVISPHSFFGGTNLLSSNSIKVSISIPSNTYQQTISFYAMAQGSTINFTLTVNSNVIPISNSINKMSGNGICSNSSLSYMVALLTYVVSDSKPIYDIMLSSSTDGWGIRGFSIVSSKCYPTCTTCFGPLAYQCWNCIQKQYKSQQTCFCEAGYYIKFADCYQGQCYTCSECPQECLTCQDITGFCTSCPTGTLLKAKTCISNASCIGYFSPSAQLCKQNELVVLQHFINGKVEQYFDYWFNSDATQRNYDCWSTTWVPFQGSNYLQFSQVFTNYHYDSYNYAYKFSLLSSNKDSTDSDDSLCLIETNTMNYCRKGLSQVNEGTFSVCGQINYTEMQLQISQQSSKSNQNFQIRFQSTLNEVWDNEGWLIKNAILSFLFCHPTCNQCNPSTLICTLCILNSTLQSSSPSCTCNSNYYLSIDNTHRGICLSCFPSCQTCQGPSFLDCLTCAPGYIFAGSQCILICQSGMYWKNSVGKCFECSSCCSECKGPLPEDCYSCATSVGMTFSLGKCYFQLDGQQCTSCSIFSNSNCGGTGQANINFCNKLQWFAVDSLTCGQCTQYYEQCGGPTYGSLCTTKGYLFNPKVGYCFSCSMAISDLCGVEDVQVGCSKNGWVFYQSSTCIRCSISYRDTLCSQCHSTCLTCVGPSEIQCLTCRPGILFFEGYCLSACPNGYILNALTQSCDKCSLFALTGCKSCFSTCKICSPFIISQNSDTCTVCYPSRKLSLGRCNCLDPEDSRVTYFECSYQNQAVLDILLLNNYPTITIEFGKELKEIAGNNGKNSHQICVLIFESTSLQLLGLDSRCNISGSKVIVTLGTNADVYDGDTLNFLSNALMFSSETIYIDTFLNNQVLQQQPVSVQVDFIYNQIADSCIDFKISLNNLFGDCSRGFKSITWTLVNAVSSDLEDVAIQSILANASANKQIELIIPQGTISVEKMKTIKIDYIMKNTFISTKQFIFFFSKYSISSVIKQSTLSPFFRYNQIDISMSWELKYCDSNGIPTYFFENVDFLLSSPEMETLSITKNNYSEKQYVDSILPYTLNSLTTYHFQFKVMRNSNNTIYSQDSIDLYIDPSPLIVKIQGGSKQIDYQTSSSFQSLVRDRDLQDSTADQQIALTWKCLDPVSSSQCTSFSGILVSFNSAASITIDAGTFSPYTFVVIRLSGSKDTRTSTAQCNVLFAEFNLPNLDVSLSTIDPLQQTLNQNEEVKIVINYGSNVNSDILSYSGTIVYELQSVGMIKIDYTTFRFKLWDIFSDFKSSPSFQIRFSVYNPQFFMPSSYIVEFKLNFPPNLCSLSITPNDLSNTALTTIFSLEMNDCIDEDMPISYQFFFYSNKAEMDLELESPTIVRRKQIVDISLESKITTIFPAGKLMILAIAIDRKSAISNRTKEIEISQLSVSETQYSFLISQFLDSNNKTLSTYTSQLSILSQDLSLRTGFTSSTINQQKKDIISALQSSGLLLPSGSQFGTAIDKAVNNIISSGISFSSTEQENQLSSMLNTLGTSLSTVFTSLKKEQREIQLFDYYKTTNEMKRNNNQSSSQKSADLILNLTNSIVDTINEYRLPNEDIVTYQGDQLSITTQKITQKYFCAFHLCNSTDFQSAVEDSTTTNIYGISMIQHKNDPFYNDQSFLNYTNTLKHNTNDTIVSYPFIIPQVKDTNHQQISINKEISLQFSRQTNKTEGLSCITKNSTGWYTVGCKNIYHSLTQTFSCYCEKANPTTIINNLDDILLNKNIQTAFSSQGLSNISSWTNFYEYSVFWAILSNTVIFLLLQFKGSLLDQVDNKQLKIADNFQISPEQFNQKTENHKYEKQENEKSKIEKIEPKSLNPLSIQLPNSQENQNLVIEDLENVVEQNVKEKDKDKQQYLSPQLSEVRENNMNKETNIQKEQSVEQIILTSTKAEVNSNKLIEAKNEEKINCEHFQTFRKVGWIKQILLFHNLFNIFFLYDPNQSRQLRFSIFYIRMIHSLAIAIVYDSQYSLIQIIILSVVNGVVITVVLKLLETIFNFRVLGKKIAALFLGCVLGFYYYLILSIVSGQKSEESNKVMNSYLILFSQDLLFTSTITAISFRFIANHILKHQGNIKFSNQILSILKIPLIIQILSRKRF